MRSKQSSIWGLGWQWATPRQLNGNAIRRGAARAPLAGALPLHWCSCGAGQLCVTNGVSKNLIPLGSSELFFDTPLSLGRFHQGSHVRHSCCVRTLSLRCSKGPSGSRWQLPYESSELSEFGCRHRHSLSYQLKRPVLNISGSPEKVGWRCCQRPVQAWEGEGRSASLRSLLGGDAPFSGVEQARICGRAGFH
jgi:hypothetical protein